MRLIIILFSVLIVMGACNHSEPSNNISSKNTTNNDSDTTSPAIKKFTYRILLNETGTEWGYQIFEGSKMIIKQMHIPAIQGNFGFETKEKAETTALFIMNKLENDIFPPAISPEELDSLGVLPKKKESD